MTRDEADAWLKGGLPRQSSIRITTFIWWPGEVTIASILRAPPCPWRLRAETRSGSAGVWLPQPCWKEVGR